MTAVLGRLADTVRERGGLLAGVVRDPAAGTEARFGSLAAAGPRAEADAARYELLIEAIFEGSLLHYAAGRVVVPEDPDLALLAGDQLYALGLSELAELGDLDAVGELADVISLVAQAQSGGDADLADAVWEAGATAVGWGSSDALRAAKERARTGDPDAAGALREAAARRR